MQWAGQQNCPAHLSPNAPRGNPGGTGQNSSTSCGASDGFAFAPAPWNE